MSVLAHITSRTQPSRHHPTRSNEKERPCHVGPYLSCVLARFLFTTFVCVYQYCCVFHRSPSLYLSFLVCDSTTTDHSVSHHRASWKWMSSIHTCSYVPHQRPISSNLHLQIFYSAFTHIVISFCECELWYLLVLLHKKSISIAYNHLRLRTRGGCHFTQFGRGGMIILLPCPHGESCLFSRLSNVLC